MTPDFNAADVSTWPVVLTIDHIAAIYHRAAGGIRKACQRHQFVPAPFQTPYRWRRADVLRHIDGARSVFGRQRSA